MKFTDNYQLNLPDKADQFNLEHWNQNTEKLDEKLKILDDKDLELNDLINNKFNDLLNGNPSDTKSLYYKIMLKSHPVGSLYCSNQPTDPATLFGGTWTQIKDKFILASGDIYTNGATGGEATHTLTETELPSHKHGVNAFNSSSAGSHSGRWETSGGYKGGGIISFEDHGADGSTGSSSYWAQGVYNISIPAHAHSIPAHSTNKDGGSDQPHNNMPPYVVKYCWERIE